MRTGAEPTATARRSPDLQHADGQGDHAVRDAGRDAGGGGPGWNFERELRRHTAHAVRTDESSARLDRGHAHLWPVRSGMAVAVDHCAFYSCAARMVRFTIPWSHLVGPGDDMSFWPKGWRP